MKLHIFALLFLVAGSYALPSAKEVVVVAESSTELAEENLVVEQIKWVIDLISNSIKDLGLDPVEFEGNEFHFERPFLLKFDVFFENFRFSGASNIKIHKLDYSYINNKLELDVSLPEIKVELGDSGFFLNVLAIFDILDIKFKGSLDIKSVRLVTEIEVDVSINGRISIRSISTKFSIASIESELELVVNGYEFSEILNNFFNERLPKFLEDNESFINRWMEISIRIILNIIWLFQ